jgi:hypothetical protein
MGSDLYCCFLQARMQDFMHTAQVPSPSLQIEDKIHLYFSTLCSITMPIIPIHNQMGELALQTILQFDGSSELPAGHELQNPSSAPF